MITRDDIIRALTGAGIGFRLLEHAQAHTTQDADAFIEGHEGVRTKSLFLVNRRRTARYLLIMDDRKGLDVSGLAVTLGENRLSFGSAQRLTDALGLQPGVVSPFGLIDPDHREVSLLFDAEMLEEEILTFHPGDNRATLFIGAKDLLTFLAGLGVEYRTIEV
ncbi:YbaK/EbsC family protein [Streptomyces sp. NPDC001858]